MAKKGKMEGKGNGISECGRTERGKEWMDMGVDKGWWA
jgi:hypothetical protein